MKYAEWEPYYLEIVRDFGFNPSEDARAGDILSALLRDRGGITGPSHLAEIIKGKHVDIIGPAGGSSVKEVKEKKDLIIAADSAVPTLLAMSILPDIITSDLDGGTDALIRASSMGSIVLIHAHGDNMELIRRYVPHFKGPLGGTVQTEPYPPLMNFGGFTDGDRAAFIADAMGAERITLIGFDFENPVIKPGMSHEQLEIKKRKLEWARRLLSLLDVEMV